jgi:hypothetical protein
MKWMFEVKRGIEEEKKKMARLKDCPNKLISLLGVKKTPQMRAILHSPLFLNLERPLLFSLFDLNFFLVKEEVMPIFCKFVQNNSTINTIGGNT